MPRGMRPRKTVWTKIRESALRVQIHGLTFKGEVPAKSVYGELTDEHLQRRKPFNSATVIDCYGSDFTTERKNRFQGT